MKISNSKLNILENISRCYKSPMKEFLIENIKIAIGLQVEEENQIDDKILSRIGGVPLVKENEKWPLDKNGNSYLFIMQINCSDFELVDLKHNFPKKRNLKFLFFI